MREESQHMVQYRSFVRGGAVIGLGLLVVLGMTAAPARAADLTFKVTPLVSDGTSLNPAQIQDPNLVNAWGVSFSPTGSPFWVSDNGTGLSTLYKVDPVTNQPTTQGLVVTIPGTGSGGSGGNP